MISPESWEKIKKKNRITFPKDFLTHCAALSIGTMRGILYEKVSKMNSPISQFILPLIDISDAIEEDVTVDL